MHDVRTMTHQELIALRRSGHEWTREERAVLHGDCSDTYRDRHKAAAAELVRMLDAGEYLTKSDAKRARALKRDPWWRAQ